MKNLPGKVLLLLLFLPIFTFAQTDSGSKKVVVKKNNTTKKSKDSSFSKTDTSKHRGGNLPQKKVNENRSTAPKKTVKNAVVERKKETIGPPPNIRQEGIISNAPSGTVAIHDTIQVITDRNRALEKENGFLKNKVDELKDDNKYLSEQLRFKSNGRNERPEFLLQPLTKLLFVILFISFAINAFFFVFRRKKKQIKNYTVTIPPVERQKPIVQPFQKSVNLNYEPIKEPVQNALKPNSLKTLSNTPRSFSNISKDLKNKLTGNPEWFIVGASSIGKSHITNNKPCQDNHFCDSIGYNWGIAITCDGAGSADNSSIGSEFVAKKAFALFKDAISQSNYHKNKILPSDRAWEIITNKLFTQIYFELDNFSKVRKLEFSSLACTLIVVIYSPMGLLVAHLGDGRAGYCNLNGVWESIMTPHKGEEANQTIFITSPGWQNEKHFTMSGVLVPESRVIRERAIAFTLMSDGCETHSFECSKMDATTTQWRDPNKPFPKFFDPLVLNLKSMNQNKVSIEEANIKWQKFVEEGTPGLRDESDDKTLILGVLI